MSRTCGTFPRGQPVIIRSRVDEHLHGPEPSAKSIQAIHITAQIPQAALFTWADPETAARHLPATHFMLHRIPPVISCLDSMCSLSRTTARKPSAKVCGSPPCIWSLKKTTLMPGSPTAAISWNGVIWSWATIDSAMDEYQILDGLTAEDYIAFPGNLLEEGMDCVLNDGMHTNSSEDMGGMDDGTITDDGTMIDDGTITDDGAAMDDGTITDDGSATLYDETAAQ